MLEKFDFNVTVVKPALFTFFTKVAKNSKGFPIIDQSIIARNMVEVLDTCYNMMDGTKKFTANFIDNDLLDPLLRTMLWPSTDAKNLDVSFAERVKALNSIF